MVTEDQAAVIALLSSPATHGGAPVDRVETHASIVFLAGARAWKLKRAVRYDYLDFSTPERRRVMCEAEVTLNRRTAPSIYRGVAPITRAADGTLALNGAGEAIDWVVEMERFDQANLFDRLAAANRLDLSLMAPLGAAIAAFHAAAQPRVDHGGPAGMRWVVEGNAAGFEEFGRDILDRAACARVTAASRDEIRRRLPLLVSRCAGGRVRQCHGDLHLRNIVLLDGMPTLFDAIEFNDEIACVDVLYDLAFLLMDLWRRGLPRHANAVWNAYLAETGDLEGLGLMPLFLSCRAAVRAKTSATTARLESRAINESAQRARDYLAAAEDFLKPAPPRLVAIGGFSGSGKSTLAQTLAPAIGSVPGAVILRSDEIRKRLCGVAPLARLGPEGYTSEVSVRVYAEIAERAAVALRGGHSVVADAVYARPEDRAAIERTAGECGVPFTGLWLDAPAPVLVERTVARRRDPSDADASVIAAQLTAGAGLIRWIRLDAGGSADVVAAAATRVVHDREMVSTGAKNSAP